MKLYFCGFDAWETLSVLCREVDRLNLSDRGEGRRESWSSYTTKETYLKKKLEQNFAAYRTPR